MGPYGPIQKKLMLLTTGISTLTKLISDSEGDNVILKYLTYKVAS